MTYDLFMSYSRRDNDRGQVTTLKAHIQSSFRSFAGRDLRVFFDVHPEDGIRGMDDWRQMIQRNLRDSYLFLAVLSPNYLASPYCRWEWEDYVRYEAMRQCLGDGVAPVYFVTLPDATTPQMDQVIAGWIDEIHCRQTFDLRPWHDHGEQALQEAHVADTLTQLHRAVRERLDRTERARRSPNNLIKHNPAFVGRVREMTELRNALTRNKLGVVGARDGQITSRATVQGLGGMGKTELTLAYAHAFAWDYPGGRWQIPCERFSDLRMALLHLANANALNIEFSEDEENNIALAFERVLRELNQRERCLLILDNVSDPNLLQPEYLDRLPRDGKVDIIATTRLAPRAIPGATNEQTFIAVDELPEEDALALMRNHQPGGRFASQREDDEARAIVRLLRGFTLAVETAAIYLGRNTAPDACRRFRERLSPDLLCESETAATDPAVAVRHRVRSLEKTLALTLQTLTSESRHVLNLASLLPADSIAVPWLAFVGAHEFRAFLEQSSLPLRLEPSLTFHGACELLIGLRLLNSTGAMDSAGRPLTVRMHRMVQEIMRKGIADRIPVFEEALWQHIIDRAGHHFHRGAKSEYQWELVPLAECSWDWMERGLRAGVLLAHETIQALREHDQFREAERLACRALQQFDHNSAADDPLRGKILTQLGVLLRAKGQHDAVEELYRRALENAEKNHGPEHILVATALNNLARWFLDSGRRAEAEPMLIRALAIAEKPSAVEADLNIVDPNRISTLSALLNTLADLFRITGRLSEAERLLKRALAVDTQDLGEEHPNVARDLDHLAWLYLDSERLEEAEPVILRAMGDAEKRVGSDHTSTAAATRNLARLRKAQNRLADARRLYQDALRIDEKVLIDHPQVSADLVWLADVLRSENDFNGAELAIRRALAMDERLFGPNHPRVATDLSNLACLLRSKKQLSEAEQMLRRALTISEQNLNPDHPSVAVHLNNLAQVLQATNRLAAAEPLMRRTVEIFLKYVCSTGHWHQNSQAAVNSYTALLQQMGMTQAQARQKLEAMLAAYGIQKRGGYRG